MGTVSDESMVLFAGTLLRDTAADWWRGVSQAITAGLQSPIHSWAEFKARLTAHFQPVNEEDFARQQIRILKQTGGVRDYVSRYQALILQIPSMDERSKVDNFTAGLKTDVRHWVKLQDPHTLEAAMHTAERYQTMLLQDKATLRTYSQLSRQDGEAAPMELGFIGGSKPAGKGGGRPDNRKKPAWTAEGVPICLACNRPGHMKKDCK
jgi:hypothetical protein